jgi:hypothetical protein
MLVHRTSNGRSWSWWPRTSAKAAERSAPSASGASTSSHSKLSEASEDGGAAAAAGGRAAAPAVRAHAPAPRQQGGSASAGDAHQAGLAEEVSSPPASMGGCLSSVFARARSEDIGRSAASSALPSRHAGAHMHHMCFLNAPVLRPAFASCFGTCGTIYVMRCAV